MAHKLTRRGVIVGTAALAAVPVPFGLQAASSQLHDVEIRSFAFHPSLVQARAGDTIRWTNRDLAPHTATADEFGWDTGALEKGANAEIQVTDGMETTYFCVFHPHMKGQIKIVA